MRIIDTFAFVLIAGILCSGITLGYSPRRNGLFQGIADLHSSTNLSTADEQMEAMNKLLIESCEKNGGPKAYDTVNKGWQNFIRCAEDSEAQVKNMQYTADSDHVINVKKYCTMIGIEENCFKELKRTLEPCLELGERDGIEIIYNIITSSLDFLCEIDGARITKFIDDGGVQCLQSKHQALLSCTKDFSSHYNSSSAINSESATAETLSFLPNIEDCINMDKFQLCNVKVLNECEHHTPSEIVDALFNSIKREMHCTKLNNAQVSVSSAIDVMIITIAMAIFVQFA